jgi:hypothetical protein
MDVTAEQRATRLRTIAQIEIARHRETAGFLGAALDGSLATGAVWPSSDLDFTIVPLGTAGRQDGVEWGEREGIVWHKHFNNPRQFRDLIEGYPESFIRPAVGPFDPDANWLLDGLAVMEVVEDPEGLMTETRRFVSARRFAPPVWEGRRAALMAELRRQRDVALESLDSDRPEEASGQMGSLRGFASVAAQLWLESAGVIYSSKEQDGRLAAVTRAFGHREVHALYRQILGVDLERAAAAVPLVRALGDAAAGFYDRAATLSDQDSGHVRHASVWAAWIRHLADTLCLAPAMSHPAYLYQRLGVLRYWTAVSPRETADDLAGRGVEGAAALDPLARESRRRYDALEACLMGEVPPSERARSSVAAAEQLLAVTERAV